MKGINKFVDYANIPEILSSILWKITHIMSESKAIRFCDFIHLCLHIVGFMCGICFDIIA